MFKSICIFAEDYPTDKRPSFTFVQELAYSLSNEGIDCTVVAPQSIVKAIFRRVGLQKVHSIDQNPEGEKIHIYRPYTLSFSNTKNRFLKALARYARKRAIKYGYRKANRADAFYAYFWHVGFSVAECLINADSQIPLFVQASECDIEVSSFYREEKFVKRVTGVVCASKKNLDESIDEGFVLEEADNYCVVPNGYRKDEFYDIEKECARDKLGFPKDKFIVAFVGGFIERKGVRQLSTALDRFSDVYSIFVGSGDVRPTCRNVLYCGKVQHNQLVNYLNCADVFVLPTSAEGCCNAIIEALACGLPVVSSNKSFNDEILDGICSIRINEQDADEIWKAIELIYKDKDIRKRLAAGAKAKAETLLVENRARSIKQFIDQRIGE